MVVPNSSKKEQTLKLMEEKDRIERQIGDYGKVLEANANVGMTGPLVDVDGFPRNDIDVYQVRHARHEIICLQNDLKELMKNIERGLQEVHAEAASAQTTAKIGSLDIEEEEDVALTPIVKVNLVSPGSPAEDAVRLREICSRSVTCLLTAELHVYIHSNSFGPNSAGLRIGDEIIEFGSVNSNNFQSLTTIADVVNHKKNQRIILKVKREDNILKMNLTPRTWNGRGLLGCNIVLPDSIER